MRIVTEAKELSRRCAWVDNDEGYKVGKRLLEELSMTDNGVGLAANQIGINKRVCVVNVSRSIILINPEIVDAYGRIIYEEGCLSFPEKLIVTERFRNVAVKASNYQRPLYFGSENMLECVCIQHEIDHLNGKTMFDRASRRNDIMGSAYL